MRFAVRFLRHQGLSIPWRMIANQSAKIGVSIERDEDGNAAADILMLKVLLSDGSIAATWWGLQDMARFCSRIGMDVRRPANSVLQ